MTERLTTFAFDNGDASSRGGEPVRFGVSLNPGTLERAPAPGIIDARTGLPIENAAVRVLSEARGGREWLEVEMVVDGSKVSGRTYALVDDCSSTGRRGERPGAVVRGDTLHVPLTRNRSIDLCLYVIDEEGSPATPTFLGSEDEMVRGTLGHRVELNADVELPPRRNRVRLSVALTTYPGSDVLEAELLIHNSAAARHENGLWDLGEPTSAMFREIGIRMSYPEGGTISMSPRADIEDALVEATASLQLDQLDSGVPPHGADEGDKDRHGFRLVADGETAAEGSRSRPLGVVRLPEAVLTLHVRRFWQEHPSALRINPRETTVALFAETPDGPHELQPGERKRRAFTLHVAEPEAAPAYWLASPLPPPRLVENTASGTEHFLRATTFGNEFDTALSMLLVTPDEFLAKREVADEYGWRNFGDVFADHESLYLDPSQPRLVSHYNNQYDLVLGFGMQYLRTRDERWRELMDDLARHVVDIDIYRTEEDRVEYNHGLFWHTNHYVDAGEATHRTFSRRNFDPDDPGGSSGGPGPEHCYTSGLALHYLLSGDETSKAAVIGMATWMRRYFHGDDALLGRLHSIARHEVPALREIVARRGTQRYAYPLTRATGNLLVAYLDAYHLSGDRGWVDEVESVLLNTFHPDDDVGERGLDDVERTWSHTVFLQSVLRYLDVKEALEEIDATYALVRRAFLRYARWTKEHAIPYLDAPEKLEFVNDTWAAQEVRRSILMFAAAAYDETHAAAYLKKASTLGAHAIDRLGASDTCHFTRIQAILLQNLGMASVFTGTGAARPAIPSELPPPEKRSPSVSRELRSAAAKLGTGLKGFDPRAEIRWFRLRR